MTNDAHNYTVYHIRLPEDNENYDEGYIGITNNPRRRWLEHKRGDCRMGESPLVNLIADGAEMAVIQDGLPMKRACQLEGELRPERLMGLNAAAGGNYALHAAHKGEPLPDEVKQRISKTMTGRKRTAEERRSLSKGQEGNTKRVGHFADKGTPLQETFRLANRWYRYTQNYADAAYKSMHDEFRLVRNQAHGILIGKCLYRAEKVRHLLDVAERWRSQLGEPPYGQVAQEDIPF